MNPPAPRRHRRVGFVRLAALAPLALAAMLVAGSAPPVPDGLPAAAVLAGGSPPPAAATPPLPLAAVAPAASALRHRDCAAALARLDRLAAAGEPEGARFARLLRGLYAHACDDPGAAETELAAAAGRPEGALEDWRLFILADSAAARGHLPAAEAALAGLLADHPGSPLAPRALARAATLAWQRRDAGRTLALVEVSRRSGLAGEAAAEIETLAWQIGGDLGDPAVRAAAARRLLVEAPLAARRLQVADAYRQPGGDIAWSAVLGAADLERRAASFLALDMAPAALSTLEAVPVAERGESWRLLGARALTADRRGSEALALLSTPTLAGTAPASPAARAELAWARALAGLDAATAYRGRTNLPSDQRETLRRAALQQLRAAAAADGADAVRRAEALRRLFIELSDDAPFDDVLDLLRELRRLDATDTTGARTLWDRGWAQYADRNYSGAVGYWTELGTLYPENRYARAGRYWAARSFAALGEGDRARRLFAEIAATDTTDFYRKYALARLDAAAAAIGAGADDPREPWPDDPHLTRARLLTDLGLDDLALAEIDVVGSRGDPRANAALSALAHARRGDRWEGMVEIRRAFPSLGGPFQMRLPEEALRIYYPLAYVDTVRTHAERAGLDLDLVFGIIRQESAFDAQAKSRSGALGLMQVMPRTGRELARRLGLSWSTDRLADPDYNLRLGTTYFRQVLTMFDGNVDLALAGYNGGPYRLKRLWGEAGADRRELDAFLEGLTIEESKTYVKRILILSDGYRKLYPDGRDTGVS